MFVKIGSIIGAAVALAGAITLALKTPSAKGSQQTVISLAPVAEGGISFSR